MADLAMVERTLATFVVPGQVVSVQALYGPRRAKSYCTDNLAVAARRALDLEATNPIGVYLMLNPIMPDFAGTEAFPKNEHVSRRHWFTLDVDPPGHKEHNATEAESALAWTLLDRCRSALENAGLVGAVVGFSGNGWQTCYPVLLPNDGYTVREDGKVVPGERALASMELVKAVLKQLATYEDDAVSLHATVGVECHDAKRIWPVYGTMKRKHPEAADRPHRQTLLLEGQPWNQDTALANVAALRDWLERLRLADNIRKNLPTDNVFTRARNYANKEPPSIQGQNGSGQCYHVAAILVEGFALNREQAFAAIADWNRTCQPPWSDAELWHKIDSAIAKINPAELGRLADNPQPAMGGTQQETGETPPPGNGHSNNGKVAFPLPIPASQLKEGEQTSAIWKGLISRGSITLISALWKAGKTTLLVHLIRAMEEGGQFCGLDLTPGAVLYVTEESESRWAKRRDRHALHDHIDFLIRPFTAKPGTQQWLQFLGYLQSLLVTKPRDLVVFDTLTNLWPVQDENDACRVQAALMPLHSLPDTTGQLLVHHTRKGDGQEATATRGSGALTAFVDTILEFRRFSQTDREDKRRVLTGYGRDEDTPDELVIELTDLDGYVPQGRTAEVRSADLGELIAEVLPTMAPGMTFTEIMDAWKGNTPPGPGVAFVALQQGIERGTWVQTGRGVRGDPHRYYRVVVNGVPDFSP